MTPGDTGVEPGRIAPPKVEMPPRRRSKMLLVFGTLTAVTIALTIGVLTARRDGTRTAIEDPGLVHVHGLGVNPADGLLYAATHSGLFRVEVDGSVSRIADRYQDTMGFTVAGSGRFLASGHPDLRDDTLRRPGRPPLLGLVESTDAGRSWQPLSLLGDADLHTIVKVDGRLIGYDSTGERVLASADGQRWETRSSIALVDLAVDPGEVDRMVAIDITGRLVGSGDGGRSWTPQPGEPPSVRVLRWGGAGLWGAGADGSLYRYDDSAQRWSLVKRFGGPVEALLIEETTIYAAVAGIGIAFSDDGGQSWQSAYKATGASG